MKIGLNSKTYFIYSSFFSHLIHVAHWICVNVNEFFFSYIVYAIFYFSLFFAQLVHFSLCLHSIQKPMFHFMNSRFPLVTTKTERYTIQFRCYRHVETRSGIKNKLPMWKFIIKLKSIWFKVFSRTFTNCYAFCLILKNIWIFSRGYFMHF